MQVELDNQTKSRPEFTGDLRRLIARCAKALYVFCAVPEIKNEWLVCIRLCQAPNWLLSLECSFACSHVGVKHTPSSRHEQDVQFQFTETQKFIRSAFQGVQVVPRLKVQSLAFL